jgi:hypothetical protein
VEQAATNKTKTNNGLSGKNLDVFPTPNDENFYWDFLLGETPIVDKGRFFPSQQKVM